MTNEEIVQQIQSGIMVSVNQERLWEKNKRFVSYCIKKYIGSCEQQDYEDFMNEGFIGLVTAAMRYKAELGVKFLTFASFYVRAALYRYNGLNTYTVRIPEYLKERMRKLVAYKQEYRDEYHREPDPEEIQKALSISARSLMHLEKTILNLQTKSLDEYISEDGSTSLMDTLSTDERIDDLVGGSEYQKELHEELEEALKMLDEKTALMIRCAYYQNRSYNETAEIFGCTKQAVNTRIKQGFYKILHSKHREALESFMWEGYHMDPKRLSDYVDMEKVEEMSSEFLL